MPNIVILNTIYKPKTIQMKIGVDLGGTNIRAGLIDGETIVNFNSTPLKEKNNLDSTLDQLKSLIHSIFNKDASGIGIGVPSVVDIQNGIVYDVVNIPSWKEVHLKRILEEEFGVPVYINNDVNCFVMGEKHFGFGKKHDSIVGVAIGTGIGAGIIIENKLFSGGNCGAGEIGYLPYLDHDLEYYCSSNFFDKEHHTKGHLVYEAALQNDTEALQLWAEFGKHLGIALRSVVYAYDPEAIILGGAISKAYPFFEEQMKISLRDCHFPNSIKKLKIYISEVENVSMLGAAALVDQSQEIIMN